MTKALVQAKEGQASSSRQQALFTQLTATREITLDLARDLSDGDATAQSMTDASPSKWHLAHTSWFFETLVLKPFLQGYKAFDSHYNFLFNSYYETVGARHPRQIRGLLTRPHLDEIRAYRAHVDEALEKLGEETLTDDQMDLIELGINHEQQHQELFLTDLLHLFSFNSVAPVYREKPDGGGKPRAVSEKSSDELAWHTFRAGLYQMGTSDPDFAFDCERPNHPVHVPSFAMASRPVTNGEWIAFMEDGGYSDPLLWLSDGWAHVQNEAWDSPLYWTQKEGVWHQMTLHGLLPVDKNAYATHVSYYEADAFASWAGARLPTEFEWERASAGVSMDGHYADSGHYVAGARKAQKFSALFGSVWEWTRSAFTAYPGFKTLDGAPSEYNGKFMCGQFVLKGGSCATPEGHMRASYRNFFYPHQRWQFTGLRLAKDI